MDRKRSNSLQVHRLVFGEIDLARHVNLVMECQSRGELEQLCLPWSNTQRLQVVSRLLLKRELESALTLLCLFPSHSRRVGELKLQALMDLERYEEAELQATILLADDPNCAVTREKRMVCRRRLGRKIDELTDKLFLLERVGAEPARLHRVHMLRGSRYLRAKDLDRASEDLRKGESYLSGSADSLALRGKLAYEFGDFQDAVGFLTCSMDIDDSERLFPVTSLLTERSLAQQKMGRNDLALDDLNQAVEAERRSEVKAWLLWMRANLLYKLGDKERAAKDLRRGLVLDPSNVHIKILHGKLANVEYDPKTDNDESWQSVFSVALSLYTQGKYEEALSELDKLELRGVNDLQVRFWKAQIYLCKGDLRKGQKIRESLAADALSRGKVLLWAWATDLDWRCRLDDLWHGR